MHTAKAARRGGSHVDASACRGVGDFGIPVFHRAGRFQRSTASSLNWLPDHGIPSVEQFVEPSVFATDSAQTSAGIVVRF
jgi:hypothetical protein